MICFLFESTFVTFHFTRFNSSFTDLTAFGREEKTESVIVYDIYLLFFRLPNAKSTV